MDQHEKGMRLIFLYLGTILAGGGKISLRQIPSLENVIPNIYIVVKLISHWKEDLTLGKHNNSLIIIAVLSGHTYTSGNLEKQSSRDQFC